MNMIQGARFLCNDGCLYGYVFSISPTGYQRIHFVTALELSYTAARFFDCSRNIPPKRRGKGERKNFLHMASAHFPINRVDRGGMNLDEQFIGTWCGALHFDLCQNFGSAVLVNSYCFHNHFLRFVVYSLFVSVVLVTI